MTPESVRDLFVGLLLAGGTAVMTLGTVGLLRMPDVYTRAQAASKTSTLGLVAIFVGVALELGSLSTVARALAVVAFAFLSVPVAAHMVIRCAHFAGVEPWKCGERNELRRDEKAGKR